MPDETSSGGPPPTEEPGRRLADLLSRIPKTSPLLGPEPTLWRPLGARIAIFVFLVLVAVVLALVLATRLRRSPGGPGSPAGPGTLLRPLEPSRNAVTGEETAAFAGFAVSVDTIPAGALVTVAGVARGEAPVFAGVDCAPGDRIEIRAERAGLDARATTACRADTLVKLKLRLGR